MQKARPNPANKINSVPCKLLLYFSSDTSSISWGFSQAQQICLETENQSFWLNLLTFSFRSIRKNYKE